MGNSQGVCWFAMRLVALALVLALGPVGSTLCELSCVDARALLHDMAGASAGAQHAAHRSSAALQHTTGISTSHQHASAVPADRLTVVGDSACSHSEGVLPSILRDRSSSSLVLAAADAVSAGRVDVHAIALEVLIPPPAPPPLHSALLVPLRI